MIPEPRPRHPTLVVGLTCYYCGRTFETDDPEAVHRGGAVQYPCPDCEHDLEQEAPGHQHRPVMGGPCEVD